jgi:hypothetical protein
MVDFMAIPSLPGHLKLDSNTRIFLAPDLTFVHNGKNMVR